MRPIVGFNKPPLPALWLPVGNGLSIPSTDNPYIAALDANTIAYIGPNDQLRTYQFDGTDWAQVGNSLILSGITNARMTPLSSTRIAFTDSQQKQLRAYDFDGSDWSLVGSGLNFPAALASIAALSSTRIVGFIPGAIGILGAWDFNGSSWSAVSSTNPSATTGAVSRLSSTRVAFFDIANDRLRTHNFDGSSWTTVGNYLNFGSNIFDVSADLLDSASVAAVFGSNGTLYHLAFDGTDWSISPGARSLGTIGAPAVASLTSSRIAVIDSANDVLQTYDRA